VNAHDLRYKVTLSSVFYTAKNVVILIVCGQKFLYCTRECRVLA
jgi:hypothetical protein